MATLADSSCLAVEVSSVPSAPEHDRPPELTVAWHDGEGTSTRSVALEPGQLVFTESPDPEVARVGALWTSPTRGSEPRFRLGVTWAVEADELAEAWVEVERGEAPLERVDLLGCAF